MRAQEGHDLWIVKVLLFGVVAGQAIEMRIEETRERDLFDSKSGVFKLFWKRKFIWLVDSQCKHEIPDSVSFRKAGTFV